MDKPVESHNTPALQKISRLLYVSLHGLVTVAVTLACIATVVGFCGRLGWPFELLSHFKVQYFLFLSLALVFYLFARSYYHALIATVFTLANFAVIVPLYLPDSPSNTTDRHFRVLVVNFNSRNTSYDRAVRVIQEKNADFLIATEVNRRWERELAIHVPSYRFVFGQTREDDFGIMFLSKKRFRNTRLGSLGIASIPFVMAELEVNGNTLTIAGMHPLPPVSLYAHRDRELQMKELAKLVAGISSEVVVAGDLNMTSWCPIFQDLIGVSGLHDTRRGFGIQATFPTDLPFLLIPIDHCLTSKGLVTVSHSVGPNIGSDHYPVTVDLAFRNGHR